MSIGLDYLDPVTDKQVHCERGFGEHEWEELVGRIYWLAETDLDDVAVEAGQINFRWRKFPATAAGAFARELRFFIETGQLDDFDLDKLRQTADYLERAAANGATVEVS